MRERKPGAAREKRAVRFKAGVSGLPLESVALPSSSVSSRATEKRTRRVNTRKRSAEAIRVRLFRFPVTSLYTSRPCRALGYAPLPPPTHTCTEGR